MKILHIINSLDTGGAERALLRLAYEDSENSHTIICLKHIGVQGLSVAHDAFTIVELGVSLKQIWRLIRLPFMIKKFAPDVVQTWMYHSDLIGGVAARMVNIQNICWGVRGPIDIEATNKTTVFIARCCASLSHFIPRLIICNSNHAKNQHALFGYSAKKLRVVHNGVPEPDIELIREYDLGAKGLRKEIVFGHFARFDPHKDHDNLLTALGLLKSSGVTFSCLLAGKDVTYKNKVLVSLISENKLETEVVLLGETKNIEQLYQSIDVCVLSSRSESFPNVIAEAMSYGRLCVSTNVGDAEKIIGSQGWLCEPQNSAQLCTALKKATTAFMNKRLWSSMSRSARDHISNYFSLHRMVKSFHGLWR